MTTKETKKEIKQEVPTQDTAMEEEFDGIFKFSNTSDEDFMFLWNNKEYVYPAHTSCAMIIANESAENIQEIRKRAAMKFAQRELMKSKEYRSIEKEASKHVSPATYNENILEAYIQQCLSPLPLGSAKVNPGKVKKPKFIDDGSAVLEDGSNVGSLSSSDGPFKDYTPPSLGAMSK